MRIWIRNFFIAFAISLIVFAIPAYFLVNYATGQINTFDSGEFTTEMTTQSTSMPVPSESYVPTQAG